MFSCSRRKVVWNLSTMLSEMEDLLVMSVLADFLANFQSSGREAGKWRHLLEKWNSLREPAFQLTLFVTIIQSFVYQEWNRQNKFCDFLCFLKSVAHLNFCKRSKNLRQSEGQMKMETIMLPWCWCKCWQKAECEFPLHITKMKNHLTLLRPLMKIWKTIS